MATTRNQLYFYLPHRRRALYERRMPLWKQLGSNQRPPDLQSGTLPTELHFHM